MDDRSAQGSSHSIMWSHQAVTGVVLSVLILCHHGHLVEGQNSLLNFNFPSFKPSDEDSILEFGDVKYNSSLNSYDMNYFAYANHTEPIAIEKGYCGRILHKHRVRMVDKASGKVASFSTSFTFAFQSRRRYMDFCGEGMTFTFAASPIETAIEANETGQTKLGDICTFDYDDKRASNRVFAVKVDSNWNSDNDVNNVSVQDLGNANIGLSVTSLGNTLLKQYSVCPPGTLYCAFFCGDQGDFSVWVDYDSVVQTIEIRFRNGSLDSGRKPVEPVIRVSNLRLDEVLDEYMYVGFRASATDDSEYARTVHRIKSWNFNSSELMLPATPSGSPAPSGPNSPSGPISPVPSGPKSERPRVGVIVGGICGAVFGAALIGLLLWLGLKHRRSVQVPGATKNAGPLTVPSKQKGSSVKNPPEKPPEVKITGTSREFTYKELCKVTKNFNDTELLSSGGFGDVYRGSLPSGDVVAVKRIKHNKAQGPESFLAEANSLRQIRHRNLLQLRGWCQAKEGLFLVYDFMCNGSLDKWLHPSPNPDSHSGELSVFEAMISWDERRFILAGIASGLAYLHEDWVQCVLHRDIKSSNVMLDADFNAYLGDFGLARLVDHHKLHKTTLLAGTLGYMAPEMQYTGRATKETDVFAFGILALEVVCGRRPLEAGEGEGFLLLDSVWRGHEAGNLLRVADPRLSEELYDRESRFVAGVVEEKVRMVVNILRLGLLCCLPQPSERPSMRQVNHWFQSCSEVGVVELRPLPAAKPGPYRHSSPMPQSVDDTSSLSSDVTRGSYQTWTSSEK